MAVTFTTNKGLAEVTVGTEAGTWGPYINGNAAVLDNNLGGVATVALTNSTVVLSSGQYGCAFIRFTGAITANIPVAFPAIGSFYTIINDITNSSNFTIIAAINSSTEFIGLPTGVIDILTDGANVKFRGLPEVGSYKTFAGTTEPLWLQGCSKPPYLYCDGTAFSSATYPGLSGYLGTTTLPDLRGRYMGSYNDGTGRITGTVDGNTLFASGGAAAKTVTQGNLPSYALTVTDPGHAHDVKYNVAGFAIGGTNAITTISAAGSQTGGSGAVSNTTGITVNSGGSGTGLDVLPPTIIAGTVFIRAA